MFIDVCVRYCLLLVPPQESICVSDMLSLSFNVFDYTPDQLVTYRLRRARPVYAAHIDYTTNTSRI